MSLLFALLVGVAIAKILLLPALAGVLFGLYLYTRGSQSQGNFEWNKYHYQSHSDHATYYHHLFSFMGYIAKADGIVTKEELTIAENIMAELGLNYSQKSLAKSSFKSGSQGLNLANLVAYLALLKLTRPGKTAVFFSTVERIVHADHHPKVNQLNIINQIKFRLYHDGQQQTQKPFQAPDQLSKAYKTLGINANMTYPEMKKAYQRIVGKHHPDRARTESEKQKSEAYIKQIQSAWAIVKSHQKETV